MPPEYAGGLGDAGVDALKAFVTAGGTLICLDQSGELAISAFTLPVKDVVREAGADKIFCPGSILRVELDASQPLAFGMNPHTAGFFASSSAFESTSTPADGGAAARALTIARYADKDVLVSGWLEGESVIAGKPGVVQLPVGSGRVVLLGFPVQHRAQSLATFRLLFNAILTAP